MNLDGKHEFKIAEESWLDSSTIGKPAAQPATNIALSENDVPVTLATAAGGITNVSYVFAGAQTLRLAFSDIASKPTLSIGPKKQKPDAITIAETWFDASKYFLGDTFDSAMNYIFRNTILEYAAGGKANALYHNIELMREAYPPQSFYAMMNLLSSHDQPRATLFCLRR